MPQTGHTHKHTHTHTHRVARNGHGSSVPGSALCWLEKRPHLNSAVARKPVGVRGLGSEIPGPASNAFYITPTSSPRPGTKKDGVAMGLVDVSSPPVPNIAPIGGLAALGIPCMADDVVPSWGPHLTVERGPDGIGTGAIAMPTPRHATMPFLLAQAPGPRR